MKLTNREIFAFHNGLLACIKAEVGGGVFCYAITKNIRKVEKELKAINDAVEKLRIEKAQKGKDGEPIIKDGNYVIDDIDGLEKEGEKILALEVELDVFKINEDAIPDSVTPKLTNGIWWMLDGVD
jgi:hypothetical protein